MYLCFLCITLSVDFFTNECSMKTKLYVMPSTDTCFIFDIKSDFRAVLLLHLTISTIREHVLHTTLIDALSLYDLFIDVLPFH